MALEKKPYLYPRIPVGLSLVACAVLLGSVITALFGQGNLLLAIPYIIGAQGAADLYGEINDRHLSESDRIAISKHYYPWSIFRITLRLGKFIIIAGMWILAAAFLIGALWIFYESFGLIAGTIVLLLGSILVILIMLLRKKRI